MNIDLKNLKPSYGGGAEKLTRQYEEFSRLLETIKAMKEHAKILNEIDYKIEPVRAYSSIEIYVRAVNRVNKDRQFMAVTFPIEPEPEPKK